MPDNLSKNQLYWETRIALWGPTGSGKDWLIRAFVKELQYYNQMDEHYYYQLVEVEAGREMPATAAPPINIPPTAGFRDIHYIFERVPREPQQNTAHQLKAARHNILINNASGKDLVKRLDDLDARTSELHPLISAKNIFLALDFPSDAQEVSSRQALPAASEGSDTFADQAEAYVVGERPDIYASPPDASRSGYYNVVQKLLASLGKNVPRNLAVCLTKSDQSSLWGDPWAVLQRRYGISMRRALESYRSLHKIEIFPTSAAGYLRQEGKIIPNMFNGALLDVSRWEPLNTAAPFFWIFEQIERADLRNRVFLGPDPQKLYIPYPRPRDF